MCLSNKGKIMALKAKGKKAVQAFVDERKFFDHNSLSGMPMVYGMGKLPEPYRSQLDLLDHHGIIDRVLYSYETPIAWRTKAGTWVVPEVHYSNATTNHQNVTRVAIDNPGFYANAKW